MKKNVLQKVLVLALTGAMVMGMLSGCGGKGSDDSSAPSDAQETQDDAADDAATKDTSNADDADAADDTAADDSASGASGIDSWEAFGSNVTLKVAVYDRGVEGVPTVDDNYWTKWVQENFGDKYNITVQYVPITRTDVMTDYALLAAADDLPTILMEYDYPKVAQWANDGYLTTYSLDDFAQVAPTYYQRMVDNNQLSYTELAGETYFALALRPYYNTTYTYQNFVRLDWLKQVGYNEVPKTYDDMVDALQKIMDAGICEHPGSPLVTNKMVAVGADTQNYGFRTYPLNEEEWAVYGDYNVVPMNWEPTKKYLQTANELYNLGITNPEYYITDDETWKADFINGKAFNYSNYISANMDFLNSFYENNPDAELAIVPADAEYAGSYGYRTDNPFGMIIGFSSSATEDELKAAWMYMEWMTQEENLFTMQWGIEGENYNVVDGLPVSVQDYSGDYTQGFNNSKDYWCVTIESRNAGSIEEIIAATTPAGLPQDFTQDVIDFYNKRLEISQTDYACTDAIYAVTLESLSEYSGTLASLWTEYYDTLTMCKPEEFEAKYEELSQKYLDAGFQAIIDERTEAYNAGNTTKLQ
ncbi:MAG: sugar ABC transporter substrate-binding protein [Lachnospiraceae bacterium]|nr:sugar ABC transporter substrate-binding protein [Lachnospiraceae bacterium]